MLRPRGVRNANKGRTLNGLTCPAAIPLVSGVPVEVEAGGTRWYRFTAPASGIVLFNSPSGTATETASVYVGGNCSVLPSPSFSTELYYLLYYPISVQFADIVRIEVNAVEAIIEGSLTAAFAVPGTVVLNGGWTDQEGTRPQWAEYGAPSFSEGLPDGWTRYVYSQWSINEGVTWNGGNEVTNGATGGFCYEGYNEATPLWVHYGVALTAPGGASEYYGPTTDSAGNIGAHDVVAVTANVPAIADNDSTADLTNAVANWSVVQGPVEGVDLEFRVNGSLVLGVSATYPPIIVDSAYGYIPLPGDSVTIDGLPFRYVEDYTGSNTIININIANLLSTTA